MVPRDHRVHQDLSAHVYTMEENREAKPVRRRRHSVTFKAETVGACMQPARRFYWYGGTALLFYRIVHLSTAATQKRSAPPWVIFRSARWVNIRSAPTLYFPFCFTDRDS